MTIYTGYVYLWFDTKSKFYYLGGHQGLVEDAYVCSNTMMLRAYRKRPDTFKFRVLEYVDGGLDDLRDAEQRWLDMIKDTELYWTPNIQNKTVRYYNQKKLSRGGSYKGHTKNRTKPAWNKGLKGAQEYTIERNAKIAESKTKHPLRKINCLVCGDPIETKSKSKKYCGYSCSNNKHKVVVYSVSKETTKTQ